MAWGAICLGIAAGLLALVTTSSPPSETKPESAPNKYRNLWLWFTAACFAIFAFRCFCWLVYVDGDELKIQSPHNLGDLALHLTYIKEFANGVALWPDNPIFLYGKMRIPGRHGPVQRSHDLSGPERHPRSDLDRASRFVGHFLRTANLGRDLDCRGIPI